MPKNDNVALDAHIIADTDYLRQYLNEMPDIICDELDADEDDPKAIAAAIVDPDDVRFDAVCDRIVEMALDDDCLRSRLADAIHESWLWEHLCNVTDDICVDFMREAAAKAKAELSRQDQLEDALVTLLDALAQGDDQEVKVALWRAQDLVGDKRRSERTLTLVSITSDSDQGRITSIGAVTRDE